MPAEEVGDLNPLALHFVELEKILEVNAQMPVYTKPTKPTPSAFAFSIRMSGAIRGRAYEQSPELARRIFYLARYPVSRPPLPSFQLLSGFRRRRRMMVSAPMTCSSELKIKFLPELNVYQERGGPGHLVHNVFPFYEILKLIGQNNTRTLFSQPAD